MQRLHRGEGVEEEEREGEGARAVGDEREREQGRAASAIQERWRNYRRRRREEEAMRQEGRSEMPVEEDEEEEEVEVDREDVMRGEVVVEEAAEEVDRCSPSSFCCTRFFKNHVIIDGCRNEKLPFSGQTRLHLSLLKMWRVPVVEFLLKQI